MTRHVVQWWGPAPWGPALDPDDDEFVEVVQVPTPVGEMCPLCEELIEQGDYGQMGVAILGPPMSARTQIVAQHRECLMLGVVGHLVGLCRCTDYEGLSRRQAALEAARRMELFQHGQGRAALN